MIKNGNFILVIRDVLGYGFWLQKALNKIYVYEITSSIIFV
ncbi:MAG: hypothetical protein ACI9NN_001149 [Bacteroidia bacterium]|jgi:hypothetical protein